MIEAKKGATTVIKEYSLSGLTLQEPAPSFGNSKIWNAPNSVGSSYYNGSSQVTVMQNNVQIEDNVQDLSNIQSTAEGTISGTIVSSDNAKYYLGLDFENDFISKYSGEPMYDIYINYVGYDSSDNEVTSNGITIGNMSAKKFAVEITGAVKKLVVSLRVNVMGSDVDSTTITYDTSFTTT